MQGPTLEDTIAFVVDWHRKQRDKVGEPYILHVLRVTLKMNTDDERIVALLHDIVEDTSITSEYLTNNCLYPDHITYAVDCLTRRDGESYSTFIERCCSNDLTRGVKIADIEDHLEQDEITGILPERLRLRYQAALNILRKPDTICV